MSWFGLFKKKKKARTFHFHWKQIFCWAKQRCNLLMSERWVAGGFRKSVLVLQRVTHKVLSVRGDLHHLDWRWVGGRNSLPLGWHEHTLLKTTHINICPSFPGDRKLNTPFCPVVLRKTVYFESNSNKKLLSILHPLHLTAPPSRPHLALEWTLFHVSKRYFSSIDPYLHIFHFCVSIVSSPGKSVGLRGAK